MALGGSISNLGAIEVKIAIGLLGGARDHRAGGRQAPDERGRGVGEPVTYFQAVRLYSAVEVCIFTALLVVAIGGLGERAEAALGWTHGFGWIILCLLVA